MGAHGSPSSSLRAGARAERHRAALQQASRPLADEPLTRACEALMARCGFARAGLFVMDGSRRSAHANAYFTGFGACQARRLLRHAAARTATGEVEAVLAHELRHAQACATSGTACAGMCAISARRLRPARVAVRHGAGSTRHSAVHAQPDRCRTTRSRCCCSFLTSVFSVFVVVRRCSPAVSRRDEFRPTRSRRPHADGLALAAALLEAARGQRLDAHARPALRAVLLFAPARRRAPRRARSRRAPSPAVHTMTEFPPSTMPALQAPRR